MVAVTPLAVILLVMYCSGSIVMVIGGIAVIKHTEWKTNPGFLLIVSLGASDILVSLRSFIGTVEHFLDYELWPGSSDLLGVIGNLSFGCSSYHMILLAYNRFIGVCVFWKYKRYAGPRVTKALVALVWSMSLVYCIVHRFVMCCSIVWDYKIMSSRYSRIHNESNVMAMVDIYGYTYPTMVIPSVFYMFVFLKLLFLSQSDSGTTSSSNNSVDVKLCIQFFLIIGVYLLWNLAWYAEGAWVPFVVGILGCLNCVVNPFVYLVFNKAIRNAVKILFGMEVNVVAPSKSVRKSRSQRPSNVAEIQVGHA